MKILITAQELKQNMQRYVIVDVRSHEDYLAGHVRGAVNIALGRYALKSSEHGLILEADFAQLMSSVGVCDTHDIVVYDDGTTSGAVSRFWLVAKHYGHVGSVFILDGGYSACKILPQDTFEASLDATNYITNKTDGYFYTKEQIIENRDKIVLLDVRSFEEYVGDELRGNPRGGHLHGCKFLTADSFMQLKNPMASFAAVYDVVAYMNELGIKKEDTVVAY